jgi:hypothetical protein
MDKDRPNQHTLLEAAANAIREYPVQIAVVVYPLGHSRIQTVENIAGL